MPPVVPLGLRSANPGNIEYGAYARSQGSLGAGDGGRFARFPTMRDGIKALAKLLLIYFDRHKLDTIRGILSRWAPSSENNLAAYIAHVCAVTECGPDDHLNVREFDTLFWLTVAIMEHENGSAAVKAHVPDTDIEAGVALAFMV